MPVSMMGDMSSGEMKGAPQDAQRNDPTMMRSHEQPSGHANVWHVREGVRGQGRGGTPSTPERS